MPQAEWYPLLYMPLPEWYPLLYMPLPEWYPLPHMPLQVVSGIRTHFCRYLCYLLSFMPLPEVTALTNTANSDIRSHHWYPFSFMPLPEWYPLPYICRYQWNPLSFMPLSVVSATIYAIASLQLRSCNVRVLELKHTYVLDPVQEKNLTKNKRGLFF
jgi:hypothetical protein